MDTTSDIENEKSDLSQEQLISQITAVWVISESVAGGIIHGLHLPFSGIILSGFAVICICLIGYASNFNISKIESPIREKSIRSNLKYSIIKATIIVCIFKMMLSPQSPPTAYFAVLFQGIAGHLLFSQKLHFKFSCMILGGFALMESAIQRLLVLVIIYGTEFWIAFNEFIKKSIGLDEKNNYALFLAVLYIIAHILAGIYIGYKASDLVHKTKEWQKTHSQYLIYNLDLLKIKPKQKIKRRYFKKIFFLFWILLILLFLQSFFKIGNPVLNQNTILIIFFRSSLIILTWYFLLSPMLIALIKKKLKKQETKRTNEINKILSLLPDTEALFSQSWKLSSPQKNLKRISLFWKILWINLLSMKKYHQE